MRMRDWSSDLCSADLEDYRNRRQALEDGARERQETAFQALREQAEAQAIALIRTPTGFAFAPIADGAVMEPKAFNALPQEERPRLEGEIEQLQGEPPASATPLPGWGTGTRHARRALTP